MPKSILIDATHFASKNPTGVERYVDGLLPILSQKLLELGWLVVWVSHQPAPPYRVPQGVEWLYSAHTRFWGQVTLNHLLVTRKPDLFFTPSGIPPLFYAGKTVITIHDMGVYVEPGAYSLTQKIRLSYLLRLAARKASLILVPSLYTQAEVKRVWKIDKTMVNPESAEFIKGDAQAVTGIIEPFFLYVGRLERKKNLTILIQGFAKLENESRLVLAGKDGYGIKNIKKEIAALPAAIRDRILFTGYISDGQKKWLYERALVVVVPCCFEGFGIPVLEAFAHRVPVLAAQSGALPEVGGEAARYAQGDIATDWYLQMKRLMEDESLRKELITKGTKQLGVFSWEAAAEQIVHAFSML